MATRTFVADGTSRAWSLTTTWAEGAVPTAADDVVFSTNVVSSILVIDGTSGSPSLCKSIDTTNYTKTITMGATAVLNVGGSTSGAFKMTAGMTFAPNASSVVNFVSTTTGNNITHGGYAFGGMTYNGVGGGWTWQDANSMSLNSLVTLTNGSLDTNSKSITNALSFSSSNSNTRSLTLGTTTWPLGASATWTVTNSSGMTLSAASSTITDGSTAGSKTFNGGGLTYGTFSATAITTANLTFAGANTFSTLTLQGTNFTVLNTTGIFFSANQTVTGTLTVSGFGQTTNRMLLASSTLGTPITISAGTATITNTDIRDITAAGAASWNFSALTTTANGNAGGNTGITFTTPKNCYMKTASSVNWTANNWFTASGGSTPISTNIPMLQDTAIFDANSITAGSVTITANAIRLSGSNWTGVTNTPTFSQSQQDEIYGSLTLVSGMTHTGAVPTSFIGSGSYTLDGGTLTWPTSNTIIVNLQGGTLTLARNITSNAGLTTTLGTFALGGFNPTVTAIVANGGTISGTGAITGTTYTQSAGTVTLGGTTTLSSAFALSGGTLDMNSNQITGHTTATISSTGTLNLSGQLNGSGAFSITGGTITDSGASGELKGTTMSFSGGTSAIRKMTASSTFAISSTAALTFNPGTSTWVTSYTETGTTHSLTYNGTATNINGTLTVTAASAGSSFSFS